MYVSSRSLFFFLMIQRPPGSTLTYTLFPSTTLFRSAIVVLLACGKFLRMALAVDLAVRIAIEFGPLCDPLWDHVGRQPLTAHHEQGLRVERGAVLRLDQEDRKSTRLNSSH